MTPSILSVICTAVPWGGGWWQDQRNGPKWRKPRGTVEMIRVICDSGPNEECEGWRQGSGDGWGGCISIRVLGQLLNYLEKIKEAY